MITQSTTSRSATSKRSTRFRHAIRSALSVAAWALLILAILITLLLAEWVLLGIVLLGSGPAPSSANVFVILPALLVLTGLLAWLTARFFSSRRRVGQIAGLVVGSMALLGVVGSALAPDPALFLAREMAWGDSTVSTYQKRFASHPLQAAPVPFHFAEAPDPRVGALYGTPSSGSPTAPPNMAQSIVWLKLFHDFTSQY